MTSLTSPITNDLTNNNNKVGSPTFYIPAYNRRDEFHSPDQHFHRRIDENTSFLNNTTHNRSPALNPVQVIGFLFLEDNV